jgi:predicted enzyme related to lactoylglutathione lyase
MGKNSPSRDQPEPVESSTTRRGVLPMLAGTITALAAATHPAQAKQTGSNPDSGTVWWTELRTRDPARARSFYAGVIGWTPKLVSQDDPTRPPASGEKDYTLFMMRGQEAAGAEEIRPDETSARPGWLTYVQVDDVDEAIKKVATLGGKVVQEPTDVVGVGRMAEIEDPEGNRLGLMSPRA